MALTREAVERAMKVQEVIVRGLSGEMTWLQVAEGRARGRHRRRREPRPCFGELLHLDGSVHPWLALDPTRKQTLIAVVDDATKQLLYGQLVAGGERGGAGMTAP